MTVKLDASIRADVACDAPGCDVVVTVRIPCDTYPQQIDAEIREALQGTECSWSVWKRARPSYHDESDVYLHFCQRHTDEMLARAAT